MDWFLDNRTWFELAFLIVVLCWLVWRLRENAAS